MRCYSDVLIFDFLDPIFQNAFKQYFSELAVNIKDWDGLFKEMNGEGGNLAFVRLAENKEVIGFIQFKPTMFTSCFLKKPMACAKEFIEDIPDHEFPDLTDGAVCALCQQSLESGARERLKCFAEFMKGEAQTELQEAQNARRINIAAIKALPIKPAINQDLVSLVTTYDKQTGEALLPLMASATTLRNWLVTMESPDNPPEDAVKLEEIFEAPAFDIAVLRTR